MAIPTILAMTAEEIRNTSPLPTNIAYFGCHFISNGSILIPDSLPPGCGLIVDDREPVPDIDFDYIAQQIQPLTPRFVILDLQRPVESAAERLVKALKALPCPIVIPPQYAKEAFCPVFLPPIPPYVPPEDYLKPWQGREIWLELALDASEIIVTEAGSTATALSHATEEPGTHSDSMLHCHYKISKEPDRLRFYCYRTRRDLHEMCSKLPSNVTHTVGLFQELGE